MEKIYPAFKDNNIAVCFYSNNIYVPYCAVALHSLIANSSDSNNYDIIIIENGISSRNLNQLTSLIKNRPNFSIRFICLTEQLDLLNVHLSKEYSIDIYAKVFILSDVFKNYDKIISIDSDTIINKDVALLYNTELNDEEFIGAVADAHMQYFANINLHTDRRTKYMPTIKYLRNMLQISSLQYFNVGVILYDLTKCRNNHMFQKMLSYISNNTLWIFEQDAFNFVFSDKVLYLDCRWNVLNPYGVTGGNIKKLEEHLDCETFNTYDESMHDYYIMHFAGKCKPWQNPNVDFANDFFRYARHTPWYEQIIYGMVKNSSKKNTLHDVLIPQGSKRSSFIRKNFYKITDKFNGWS